MTDLHIRPETPGDREEIRKVLLASFGDDEGSRIVKVLVSLREADHLRIGLVAERAGALVGYVAVSHAWLDARQALVDVLVLSPLAIHPESQDQGVGSRLVSAVVHRAGAAGAPLVFLEGSPEYYGPHGFVKASDKGVLRPSERIPDAAAQVVLLGNYEDWMTGRLIYPEAWWRLDLAGLRDPELAEAEARLG